MTSCICMLKCGMMRNDSICTKKKRVSPLTEAHCCVYNVTDCTTSLYKRIIANININIKFYNNVSFNYQTIEIKCQTPQRIKE